MMLICRLLLILCVFLGVCGVVLALKWLGVVLLIVLFVAHVKRNRKQLTAYGTARWADEADLAESKGMLIGRLSVKKKSFSGVFNRK